MTRRLAELRSEAVGAWTVVLLALLGIVMLGLAPFALPLANTVDNLVVHGAALGVVLSAGLAWLGRPRRALLLALAFALALARVGGGLIDQDVAPAPGAPVTTLEVVTFNVRHDNAAGAVAIADLLAAARVDVVFLQEAFPLRHEFDRLAAVYPYRLGCGSGTEICETVILSRHPLRDGTFETLGWLRRERLVQATATIDGHDVSLVSVHLSKPYFDDAGNVELGDLARHLAAVPGPLVLAGDFNMAVWDRTMHWFLARTGLRRPPWPVASWPAGAGPFGLPIDHVFTRAPAEIVALRPLPSGMGSNHRGLRGRVEIRDVEAVARAGRQRAANLDEPPTAWLKVVPTRSEKHGQDPRHRQSEGRNG